MEHVHPICSVDRDGRDIVQHPPIRQVAPIAGYLIGEFTFPKSRCHHPPPPAAMPLVMTTMVSLSFGGPSANKNDANVLFVIGFRWRVTDNKLEPVTGVLSAALG
jgi:hypothetical protein